MLSTGQLKDILPSALLATGHLDDPLRALALLVDVKVMVVATHEAVEVGKEARRHGKIILEARWVLVRLEHSLLASGVAGRTLKAAESELTRVAEHAFWAFKAPLVGSLERLLHGLYDDVEDGIFAFARE